MNKKYLVFLDIDGVLTSNRVNSSTDCSYKMWHQFDPIAIQFFNKINDTYNVEFVLMSTWKNHLNVDNVMITHWIKSAFGNSGFRGKFADKWKTDPNETWVNKHRYTRGNEVAEYLSEFGKDVEDFILFDDNRYNFKEVLGKNRLVLTDPDNGLLHKHMMNAKSIMGTWEKKR